MIRFYLIPILFVYLILTSCGGENKSARKIVPNLPFGGVNAPVNGQKIAGKIDVVGWALAETGIESVSTYVDRTFVSSSATGLPRPDVAKAYPNVSGSDKAGWVLTLDTASFSPGWHELTVQARSKEGAVRDLASIPLMIERK